MNILTDKQEYINLTGKPHLRIWCKARGMGGDIYGCRKYEYGDQMEYLYYDEKSESLKWLNDNGYCSIKPIK